MSTQPPDPFSSESAMYAEWYRLAQPGYRFECRDGRKCMVVSAGHRNEGSGPDFLGSVILVEGDLRVGPVEMHRSEGEWFLHGHQNDRRYDDVILHVVGSGAARRERRTGFPTLILSGESATRSSSPDRLPVRSDHSRQELSRLLRELSWERLLNRASEYLGKHGGSLAAESLLVPIFDALGYSANRKPMRRVAERILREGIGGSSRKILEQVFRSAGLPAETERALLRRFGLRDNASGSRVDHDWNFSLRRPNRPELRLVAGAVLIDRLFRSDRISAIARLLSDSHSSTGMIDELCVRGGGITFLGKGRAGAILVNVLLPAYLAHGIECSNEGLIRGACMAYRHFPSLATNRTLREFSRRFGPDVPLRGAFLQQGVHEFMARTT